MNSQTFLARFNHNSLIYKITLYKSIYFLISSSGSFPFQYQRKGNKDYIREFAQFAILYVSVANQILNNRDSIFGKDCGFQP